MNTLSKLSSRLFIAGKISFLVVAIIALTALPQYLFAATGTISPSLKYSQFDYNSDPSKDIDLDNNGVNDLINWVPSNVDPSDVVTVSDTAITGYIWGETVGWINLSPTNTAPESPVTNNCAGELSGYAWGQNTGWINFAPSIVQNTADEPKINTTTGNITGKVWSQNYGWIDLSSPEAGFTGLNTTWHGCGGTTTSGTTTSGTTSSSSSTGVCPPFICGTTTSTSGTGTSGTTTTGSTTSTSGTTGPTTGTTSGTGTSGPTTGTTTTGTTGGTGSSTTGFTSGGNSAGIPNPTGSTGGTTTTSGPTSPTTGTNGTGTSGTGSGGNSGGLGNFFTGGTIIPNLENIPPVVPITVGVVGLLTTIPGLLARFGSMLLTVALYRRKRPWGVVYDSQTKEPLDPAYVSVVDTESGKEVYNQITDIDGRYGFFLKKGTYQIIVNKTNYLFPSKLLAGQMRDSIYENLYFGETFSVTGEEKVITLNVPMDRLATDWNQDEKRRKNLLHYFTRNHALWDALFNILFIAGFIASIIITFISPVWWNILMAALYVIIVIMQSFGFGPIKTGKVTMGGAPLPFAIVRVFSAAANHEIAHRVTDEEGRYYVLVPRSDVYVTIETKNADGTLTKVYTSPVFHASKGVLSESYDL